MNFPPAITNNGGQKITFSFIMPCAAPFEKFTIACIPVNHGCKYVNQLMIAFSDHCSLASLILLIFHGKLLGTNAKQSGSLKA